jgi:lysophospholipase L1-like esterase
VIQATQPAAELRILSLGDSYTIGESVGERECWPVRLAALLRARGLRVADPTIVARTGWTTDELSAGIDDAHPAGPFDLVTLSIGVNNQYRGRSVTEYREQFRALLARATRFAGGHASHVIVLSIPDWGLTPFASGRDRARIAVDIDAFNVLKHDEAERGGARFVDITPISRRVPHEPGLVAGDGLHPSGEMYARWVEATLPTALEILAARPTG